MTTGMFAGIDLGGTKVLVLIADEEGRVLGQARIPTLAQQGPESVITRISDAVREAAHDAGAQADVIDGIGVSAPGPIDRDAGVITSPPNLPGWHNVPLARILRERLGVPAMLENDANCGALGEHEYGAGRGYEHMLYITISTGIGAGLILNNELYAGASGAAGEVGHIPVAIDGPSCGAGHPGCLEAFSSGSGIAARARELIADGRLPRTARMAEHNPPLSAETVYLAGQQGEIEATEIIHTAGRYLGMGLAAIINAFNPQAIVIGGGLVNMGETILGPAIDMARGRSFTQSFSDVRIVEWELGEKVAALGALAAARKRAGIGTS